MKLTDPGADAAIAMAVISSITNRPLHAKSVVIGEIGLGGEIRPVQRGQDRVREALKLGYQTVVVPKANVPKDVAGHANILAVTRLEEIYDWARHQA
jgi:DNA repair protein RadA/Sms